MRLTFTPGLAPLVYSGFTLVTHVAHLFPLHSSAICPSDHRTAWVDKDSWGSQVFLCRSPPLFLPLLQSKAQLKKVILRRVLPYTCCAFFNKAQVFGCLHYLLYISHETYGIVTLERLYKNPVFKYLWVRGQFPLASVCSMYMKDICRRGPPWDSPSSSKEI